LYGGAVGIEIVARSTDHGRIPVQVERIAERVIVHPVTGSEFLLQTPVSRAVTHVHIDGTGIRSHIVVTVGADHDGIQAHGIRFSIIVAGFTVIGGHFLLLSPHPGTVTYKHIGGTRLTAQIVVHIDTHHGGVTVYGNGIAQVIGCFAIAGDQLCHFINRRCHRICGGTVK